MPLARYFDGIGMLVARSDWTPDATYVSFKAGDNYWSHTHLDQGAFTVYRNGALAIDSGAYSGGNAYGSDHHMNYAYQSIAHNTITVRDPEDTSPAPREDEPPRVIANDGGQRRIGSGWGIEAAPLDLAEWQEKYDIYHTGKMDKVFTGKDLAVAVADLTPAYTNNQSGKDTFSHRTRRVEHFTRTFGFDLVSGAIVIFDRVKSSKQAFRKRWLHHTLEKPRLTDFGYTIAAHGQNPGSMDAHVLLPANHNISIVGGIGSEFLVDGKNYDEDGKTTELLESKRRKTIEAGSWRVELSPAAMRQEDLFMVVLIPYGTSDLNPPARVRRLEDGSRIGCEITTGNHKTTWWFDRQGSGPVIQINSADGRLRTHDLRVSAQDARESTR
jgi:hypothetical protein